MKKKKGKGGYHKMASVNEKMAPDHLPKHKGKDKRKGKSR
jgi:hypothetical protein